MGFREFLARLNGCFKPEDTERIDPTGPRRSQSQLGIRPSEPAPPTLRRRKSDGEQNRWRTQFLILSYLSDFYPTGDATVQVPSTSAHHLSAPNVEKNKPGNLSSYVVDPTAAYENESDLGATVQASARLAIDVLKESSDAFTPLKSVVGGLSAILKHYEVRYTYFARQFTPLTPEPASDGEP